MANTLCETVIKATPTWDEEFRFQKRTSTNDPNGDLVSVRQVLTSHATADKAASTSTSATSSTLKTPKADRVS